MGRAQEKRKQQAGALGAMLAGQARRRGSLGRLHAGGQEQKLKQFWGVGPRQRRKRASRWVGQREEANQREAGASFARAGRKKQAWGLVWPTCGKGEEGQASGPGPRLAAGLPLLGCGLGCWPAAMGLLLGRFGSDFKPPKKVLSPIKAVKKYDK